MNKSLLLAVAVAAMAFTFSCTSDGDCAGKMGCAPNEDNAWYYETDEKTGLSCVKVNNMVEKGTYAAHVAEKCARAADTTCATDYEERRVLCGGGAWCEVSDETGILDRYECNTRKPYEHKYVDPARLQAVFDSLKNEQKTMDTIVDPETGFSCNSEKEEVGGITTNRSYCTCRTLFNYEKIVKGSGELIGECVASNRNSYEVGFTDWDLECDRNLLYYVERPTPGEPDSDFYASAAFYKKRTKCAKAAFDNGLRGEEIEALCKEDYSEYKNKIRAQWQNCDELPQKISCLQRYLGFEMLNGDADHCNLPKELFSDYLK